MEYLKKTKKEILLTAVFSIVLSVSAALVFRLSFLLSTPSSDFDDDILRPVVMAVVVSALFVFAVSKTHTEFNKSLRHHYYSIDCYPKKIKFSVLSTGFIFDAVLFAIAFALIDLRMIPAYFRAMNSDISLLPSFVILLIAFAVFVLVDFGALHSGMKSWIKYGNESFEVQTRGTKDDSTPGRSSKSVPTFTKYATMRYLAKVYAGNSEIPQLTYDYKMDDSSFSRKKEIVAYIVIVIACALLVLLSAYVFKVIQFIWFVITKVVWTWQFLVIGLVLITILLLIRLLRAFFKRTKFIKNLREACADNPDVKIKECRPYKSLFFGRKRTDECDLLMEIKEKEFSCVFLTCYSSLPMREKTGTIVK